MLPSANGAIVPALRVKNAPQHRGQMAMRAAAKSRRPYAAQRVRVALSKRGVQGTMTGALEARIDVRVALTGAAREMLIEPGGFLSPRTHHHVPSTSHHGARTRAVHGSGRT